MPSVLPGYEYDVFISYRQNDNRSGWVSEFVKGLQEELASAIKYPVSVYFDSNPHDGLLETHSVDKTLEGKLKCLIFIPVISQTYCDQTSFAWVNEFLAFKSLASNDPYTLNVRLANGNMASRILPIRIHELDPADQTLFEKESGGVMRAIDFIFRSPGVNRPLRSRDDDVKEIHHVLFYRDQINKVANAVRDLLASLKTPSYAEAGEKSSQSFNIPAMPSKRGEVILVLVAAFFYLLGAAWIWNSSIAIENKIPWIVAAMMFLPLGPVLYYFMMPSKGSKVILAATVLSTLAVPVHLLSTDYFGLAILLVIGSVLYYFTIPSISLKRSKVFLIAGIFLALVIIVHLLFSDEGTALTILMIFGPVLYYFIGQE